MESRPGRQRLQIINFTTLTENPTLKMWGENCPVGSEEELVDRQRNLNFNMLGLNIAWNQRRRGRKQKEEGSGGWDVERGTGRAEKEEDQSTSFKVFLHRSQLSGPLFSFFVWGEGLCSQTFSKEHLLVALGVQPLFLHLRLLLPTLSYLAFKQWTLTLFVYLLPNYPVFLIHVLEKLLGHHGKEKQRGIVTCWTQCGCTGSPPQMTSGQELQGSRTLTL